MIVSAGAELVVDGLPRKVRGEGGPRIGRPTPCGSHEDPRRGGTRRHRGVCERCGWRTTVRGTPPDAGLSPNTSRSRMKKLGIERPPRPRVAQGAHEPRPRPASSRMSQCPRRRAADVGRRPGAQVADFRRVVAYPKAVAVGAPGSWCCYCGSPGPPSGSCSPSRHRGGNGAPGGVPGWRDLQLLRVYRPREVALSVTLTAMSSLIALGTMPLLTAAGFALFLDQREAVDVPIARMAMQLVIMLSLPVVTGMALRRGVGFLNS